MAGKRESAKNRQPGRVSRWFLAALIVSAAIFAIWSLAPQTIGETARRKFLSQLQEHYPAHRVSIRRGHFDPKVGLIFEDLRITESSSSMLQFRAREMVRIERLIVIGDIQAQRLLDQDNPLVTRRVLIEGLSANVWLQDDGSLSLATLMPLPELGPAAPRIDLRQVKLRLHSDDPRGRPIDAELDEVVLVNRVGIDGALDQDITIAGTADFANDIKLKFRKRGNALDVRCLATGIHYDRRLHDSLPVTYRDKLSHVEDLNFVGDASLSFLQTADGVINYDVKTTIHDGRFAHASLPQPVSQLRGLIGVDPTGVDIDITHAKLGEAIVQVRGRIGGHAWPVDADLDVKAQGLMLDDRLQAALPPAMQENWQKLQPVGIVDIVAQLSHRQGTWETSADVQCRGVDVRYEKFPYPVDQVVGPIKLRGGIVSAEGLSGRVASNRMQCAFELPVKPGITNAKTFIVKTDGPIPIDSTLVNAMSPRGAEQTGLESFVRSLHPFGSAKLSMAAFATDVDGRQTRSIDLQVIDGRIRYEKFDYLLNNVSGNIKIENEQVKIRNFRATNANAGVILCDGVYSMPVKIASPPPVYRITDEEISNETKSQLAISFRASNVPMDDSLRSSLPDATKQVWDAISPSGVLDELNVQVKQSGSDRPIEMEVTARQFDHGQVTNRILSIRPSSLPYRLDITEAAVRFDGTEVQIEKLKAAHDASKVSADGVCVVGEDGRWVLSANIYSGSRLHPDAELIAALPAQMREALRRLQLRGPVSISGNTRLTLPDEIHPEPTIDWQLALQLEGNRIADVGPVHSLRGEIAIEGSRDESFLRAEGDVKIDSIHVDEFQISGVRGPFSIDGDRLYLGGKSMSRRIPPGINSNNGASSIRGKLFEGAIDLDGDVVLSSGDFDVSISVANARVPTLLADFGHGDNDLTGTLSGQMKLQGNLGASDLLKGSGAAKITGANLYQLPLIVQVMNLIRVEATEDVAFTDAEVEFTLFGDTVTFSDMQLWGDLVSLQGGGTMNRRHELDLTFNTRVSPQNTFTQLIRPLRSQRYTLMTIDVTGPLNSVQIERRALDGVGQTLERLFPGIGAHDNDSPAEGSSGPRSWFR